MMCSEYELGISNEHDGIIRLEEKEIIGKSFSEIYGLNDILIEIGILLKLMSKDFAALFRSKYLNFSLFISIISSELKEFLFFMLKLINNLNI